MGTLFGFVVGYVVGARAGNQGFDRLEQAWREVRRSEEFRGFLELLKSHAVGTVHAVSERLRHDVPILPDTDDLAERARARMRQALEGDGGTDSRS